jgi:CRP-like cAMP-binding protein
MELLAATFVHAGGAGKTADQGGAMSGVSYTVTQGARPRLSDYRKVIRAASDSSRNVVKPARLFPAGTRIFNSSSRHPHSLFIKSGWVMSCKTMSDGTRTVTDFFLETDVLCSTSSDMADETVYAVSDVACRELPAAMDDADTQLIIRVELMKRHARAAERLASIGRRDALARTGHLLLELALRASSSCQPGLDGFRCPLKQSELGDALGLSTVHVSRVLKEMRLAGLLSFRNGVVEFLNRRRLRELVDFDPDYLACSNGSPRS